MAFCKAPEGNHEGKPASLKQCLSGMTCLVAWSFLFLLTSQASYAQRTGVNGIVADESKPAEALVSLQELKGENCASLLTQNGLDKDQQKKAQECFGDSLRQETRGRYEFDTHAGWYVLHFQWVMLQPPDSKKPIGCSIQGWAISYIPWKESGKYKGFAQSPPFQINEGELKNIDFNYDGEFKIQKDCPNPVKLRRK